MDTSRVMSNRWMSHVTPIYGSCHVIHGDGFLRCSVLQCVAVSGSTLQCVAVCCSVLHCVAVCCSVLQCVAVCCSELQCVAVVARGLRATTSLTLLVNRFTRMNEIRHTHEWIMSHMNESCHTYGCVMSHVWMCMSRI